MAESTRDRNEAVRQQLLKKRAERATRKVPLAPGEMVDDALARGVASGTRWLRENIGTLQWVILGAIVAGAGYGIYDWRMDKRADAASSELIRASLDERGRISTETENSSKADEGPPDPTPVFKSADERRDAALTAYRDLAKKYPGTGPGILGRLGEAGILLDKRDWDSALAAYNDVKASPLAKADTDVRGRALEGAGFALEGKGDLEGAKKAFRELENTDVPGYREAGQYHQARLLAAQGDPAATDKAKELLKSAHEKLQTNSGSSSSANDPMAGLGGAGPHPNLFLSEQVDDLLHRLDPTATPAPSKAGAGGPLGGGAGRNMTPDDLKRLQEQFQRRMKEAQEKAASGKGNGPAGQAPVSIPNPSPAPASSGSP